MERVLLDENVQKHWAIFFNKQIPPIMVNLIKIIAHVIIKRYSLETFASIILSQGLSVHLVKMW